MSGQTDDTGARPSLLVAALRYARHGFAIFPIEPRGKTRALNDEGLQGATHDIQRVERWWKRWPDANIALATGPASGVDVLDIDGPEGELALAKLIDRHKPLPEAWESRTSSGRHLFFWTHTGVPTSKGALGRSLNTLSVGAFVIVPPSLHPDGQPYLWRLAPGAIGAPRHPPGWPPWVVEILQHELQNDPPGRQRSAVSRSEHLERSEEIEFYLDLVRTAPVLSHGSFLDDVQEAAQAIGVHTLDQWTTYAELRQRLLHAWAKNEDYDPELNPRHLDAAIARGFERSKTDKAKVEQRAEQLREKAAGGGGGKGGGGDGGGDDDDPRDDPYRRTWWQQLSKTQKGSVRTSIGNLMIIFDEQPSWQGCLGFNERTGQTVWLEQPPWDRENLQGPYPRQVRDADDSFVVKWLEEIIHVEWPDTKVTKAIRAVAQLHAFDRVREYLESLEWDGIERVDGWLVDYLGAEPSALHQAVGARWLISACARVMEPGCQADHVLVLEGKQGVGKSTALRALCPRPHWFTDQLGDVRSKDAPETLQGPWIVEIAELDGLSRAEAHTVKAFLTRRIDRYRASYARYVADRPRRCVFAATTNESRYLRDATGGRRFWPVEAKGPIQVDELRHARDQLWAEAMVRYRAGEAWHLDEQRLVLAAQEAQEDRFQADEWENIIEPWLGLILHGHYDTLQGLGLSRDKPLRITVGDALKHIGFKDAKEWERRHEMRVADILSRMGWHRKRRRDGEDGKPRWAYEPTMEAALHAPDPRADKRNLDFQD